MIDVQALKADFLQRHWRHADASPLVHDFAREVEQAIAAVVGPETEPAPAPAPAQPETLDLAALAEAAGFRLVPLDAPDEGDAAAPVADTQPAEATAEAPASPQEPAAPQSEASAPPAPAPKPQQHQHGKKRR